MYMTLMKKIMIKMLDLELSTLLEYQNVKTILQKVMFQIFLIKKDKNTVPQTFAVSDLNREEIVRTFY